MSRETRSDDVMCGFREAKIESSGGEGGSISNAARGLLFEEWDKMAFRSRSSFVWVLEIAQVLKGWIEKGDFLLAQPQDMIPTVDRN